MLNCQMHRVVRGIKTAVDIIPHSRALCKLQIHSFLRSQLNGKPWRRNASDSSHRKQSPPLTRKLPSATAQISRVPDKDMSSATPAPDIENIPSVPRSTRDKLPRCSLCIYMMCRGSDSDIVYHNCAGSAWWISLRIRDGYRAESIRFSINVTRFPVALRNALTLPGCCVAGRRIGTAATPQGAR